MDISLQITARGGIQMLHDDNVDLTAFGRVQVRRASHVEFADGTVNFCHSGLDRAIKRGWYVQSAKSDAILADGFQTRAQALAWEKAYYSPSGAGWTELTDN